jgi:hypothetical protein
MLDPQININALLAQRLRTIKQTNAKLRDLQIVEAIEWAKPGLVQALQAAVARLQSAVNDLVEAQGGRDFT